MHGKPDGATVQPFFIQISAQYRNDYMYTSLNFLPDARASLSLQCVSNFTTLAA